MQSNLCNKSFTRVSRLSQKPIKLFDSSSSFNFLLSTFYFLCSIFYYTIKLFLYIKNPRLKTRIRWDNRVKIRVPFGHYPFTFTPLIYVYNHPNSIPGSRLYLYALFYLLQNMYGKRHSFRFCFCF